MVLILTYTLKTDFNNTAGYHEILALCLNGRNIINTQTNIQLMYYAEVYYTAIFNSSKTLPNTTS